MSSGRILKELIDALQTNVSAFEKQIGAQPSRIDKLIKRDSRINLDVVQMIVNAIPEVSREWLQTGTGEMFETKPMGYPFKTNVGAKGKGLATEVDDNANLLSAIHRALENMERLIASREVDSDTMNKLATSRDRDSETMAKLVRLLEEKESGNNRNAELPEGKYRMQKASEKEA